MSVSKVDIIMLRINEATPRSPIAVFKLHASESTGILNAVFANTVETQKRIDQEDPDLLGVYDKTMNQTQIRSFLYRKSTVMASPNV